MISCYVIPEQVLKIAEDIRSMRIRGAARIGRAAAEALKIAALSYDPLRHGDYTRYILMVSDHLLKTRPTAITLPNSIKYVLKRALAKSVLNPVEATVQAAEEFITRSLKAQEMIAFFGEKILEDGHTILTHCNSSSVVSIIVRAHNAGKNIRVYATETRPRFQGHITVQQLLKAGVDVTLIIDSAVRYFMKDVDLVLVGADAIASNGAVVNKIGTSQIAVLANEADRPFYVAAETYKFSPNTMLGELVPIEERPITEVVDPEFLKRNPGLKVRNPAFDVTPPEYITAIITERGVLPPQAVPLILIEEYGWSPGEEYELEKLVEEL